MRHGSTEALIGTNVQSPIHCSKGIFIRNCLRDANVFSHPDDDDPVLIIVHCKSLYCRQPLMISRLYPGQALAADTPWRQAGGTEADAVWRWWCPVPVISGYWGLRAIPCLPPDPSGNPQFGIFFPRTQQSSAGRREREEERGNCRPGLQDTRRLMGLSPPPPPNPGWIRTIVSSLRSFCFSIRRLFLFASFSV